MPWLTPDAWLSASGAWGDRLRAPYEARGGEDELLAALTKDPRRVFALVGAPGAGASRLALELSRRVRGPVWYRDPVRAPAPREEARALEKLVMTLSGRATPLVVLDGPDPEEARAVLGELTSRRLHPRLRVIVPCDEASAPELPELAMLPRGSIVVVAIDGDATAVAMPDVSDAWLPLVLAGRGPWPLADERLAARDDASGTVVCLLDHRARAALAAARTSVLPAILDAHPALRLAITANLLRWTRVDDALVPHLDPGVDLLALVKRGVAPTPALLAHVATRQPALVARLRRDKAAATDALVADLVTDDPIARVRAGIALASLTREVYLAETAVGVAKMTATALLPEALAQLADLRLAGGDAAGARAAYDEAAELHDREGALAQAALMRSWSATIAGEAGDVEGAVAAITRVIADRRATGDALGAALALGRLARWQVELGRDDLARTAVEEAAAIAGAIGDPRNLGYAHWFLGALAERRGDGPVAIRHYEQSLDAYGDLGDVPERVVASLATLRRAYDGTPAVHDDAPLPDPEPLVTIRPKP